ncbi:uncharacterized protein KGF55_002339 [Candida pseudojiufengensis]|uniref:uncharacterized protein n=1 Tax=Candida pseudojiufengensis TaxID=497109 RepID=UPI0022251619|nr:uncharacterized protein KGF55_002339 [Candida pseudojiufengensis]KAI5963459.1 hypothetical protein KGF55_002339 [Candida pseudojiufengensis]
MEERAGHLLCGGFQGTKVTSQAYHLIVEQKISSMILSRKNAINVEQMSKLIKDLQYIAFTQGRYKYPLMFAIDEEGGIMNSLFDPEFLTQYPSAMALAATGDPNLVYEISKAIAIELKKIGFSIILGPVLDVVTKLSHQLLGVRSFGTTLESVQKYGLMCAKGLKDGGLFTVGKHFPGMGNANVDSLLELPVIGESLNQLKQFNSIPFQTLIESNVLDGVSAAGCAVPNISPDETHACLSPIILNNLLRGDLNFKGFVISECLEMEALYHSIGLGQGVILAINAGCDLVMVCHDLKLQNEAIDSIRLGLRNGNLDEETVLASLNRIENLQKRLPTWKDIFPNGSVSAKQYPTLFKLEFPEQWSKHQQLSSLAYQKSITLVRDYNNLLPLPKHFKSNEIESILVLSPLLMPIIPKKKHASTERLFTGEEVFQCFGEYLSNHKLNKNKKYVVLHTTYTANGLTPLHESLIEKSKIIIVFTSEVSRNMYQSGIVKYVSMLCGASPSSFNRRDGFSQLKKPLIIVATSSPYDFFYDKNMGSAYICCYDYTKNALEKVVDLIMGDFEPEGCIPGEEIKNFVHKKLRSHEEIEQQHQQTIKSKQQIKRRWLVDEFDMKRDFQSLINLWKENNEIDDSNDSINYNDEQFYKRLGGLLITSNQKHFVIRNSSLNILYGIVLTWVENNIGHIIYIIVEKSKRFQSIGKNLTARAIRYLNKEKHCLEIRLGSSFPLIMFPGNKNLNSIKFFKNLGWDFNNNNSKEKWIMTLKLIDWQVPQKILKELMIVGVRFDICNDLIQLKKLLNNNDDNNLKNYYSNINLNNKIPNEIKIIIALEPNSQNIIGSIILFTNKSKISKYFPFIDQCIDESLIENNNDQGQKQQQQQQNLPLIGGIVAPVIDESYSNLIDIFKYGLVCSAITMLKSSNSNASSNSDSDSTNKNLNDINSCIMIDVPNDKSIKSIEDIGFKKWKKYYDYYGQKFISEN